jgi:nucleotide-binding universal stress UspA family protein
VDTDSSSYILLALDGEPHSDAAIEWSMNLARALHQPIAAIFVKDPYLKQFYNEIYAQGRKAYLDHVQACLDSNAKEALTRFEDLAVAQGVEAKCLVRQGSPAEELRAELTTGNYSMLVLGAKRLNGLKRWRQGKLPAKVVAENPGFPVLVVPD